MINMPCVYRRNQHKIITPRFLEWIKRQLPSPKLRDSLFVYFHLIHRTFVIAQWTVPCRLFVDVMNLEHSLGNFTQEKAQNLIEQLKSPVSGAEMAELLKERERKWQSLRQNEDDEKRDYNEYKRSTRILVGVP